MNEIQVFNNAQFGEIRTVTIENEPWFVVSDVCRVLGHSNATVALERLDAHERSKFNLGRQGEVNIINESGLYTLVMRSRKAEVQDFRRWITQKVIPTIRKHGMYATDSVLDQIVGNPQFGIRLLTELKNERDQRLALEDVVETQNEQITELLPKATYYDVILNNPQTIPVTLIAKDYGMSAREFNAMLHRLGIQYKLNGIWVLYQDYANCGYTHSRTEMLCEKHSITYTTWTQAGRRFLYETLRTKVNLLPMIERTDAITAQTNLMEA